MSPEKRAHLYMMNVMENPSFMFEQRCGPAQTELLESFWQQVKEYRAAIKDHPLYNCFHWEAHFPTQQIELRYLSCNHESDSLYTINADGSFIKCPRFIGDDKCIIGKLTKAGDVEWTPEHQETLYTSRFDNAVCRHCEYLPICGSNCVFKPLPRSLEECHDNRHYYKQQVEKYVAFLLERPDSFQTEDTPEKHRASISL
jgi:radical SAM protein with 4Fe4S-binding SPASM domain